jgi:predicted RNA-binding protein YlxR (DUF448 family)
VSPRRERTPRGPGAVDSPTARLAGPVRTCVGCRVRDAKPALLRVVVADGVLTVDPAGRLPGRGASVHPDLACVDLADRRRAFPRALRVGGPLDADPVREHVRDVLTPTGERVEKA